jgi:D-alanyl-D-alanine carboxypeptidase
LSFSLQRFQPVYDRCRAGGKLCVIWMFDIVHYLWHVPGGLRFLLPDSVTDQQLDQLVRDRCMLMAEGLNPAEKQQVFATIGINLDNREISALFLEPSCSEENLGARMIAEAERLAVRFGILALVIRPPKPLSSLLRSCGYGTTGNDDQSLMRSFSRRQTRYSRQISSMLSNLGIAQNYGRIHRISMQEEAISLQSIGTDIYSREQRMLPSAAQAWLSMSQQAAADGIELQAVSAFRSVAYQAEILQRKRDKGLTMEEILAVSAAPGFSEHHTGRAIDITSPGSEVLEESFENSITFNWLKHNAKKFDFHLSFPRDNRHQVAYEPWHWAWSG